MCVADVMTVKCNYGIVWDSWISSFIAIGSEFLLSSVYFTWNVTVQDWVNRSGAKISIGRRSALGCKDSEFVLRRHISRITSSLRLQEEPSLYRDRRGRPKANIIHHPRKGKHRWVRYQHWNECISDQLEWWVGKSQIDSEAGREKRAGCSLQWWKSGYIFSLFVHWNDALRGIGRFIRGEIGHILQLFRQRWIYIIPNEHWHFKWTGLERENKQILLHRFDRS